MTFLYLTIKIFLTQHPQPQWDSDLEDDSEDDSVVAIAARQTQPKPAQPKPIATAFKAAPTIVDDTVSVLEKLSINACKEVVMVDKPVEISKPLAAAAKPAPKKPAAKKAPTKQAAPKAAPKKKAPVKKSVCLYDSSDEDGDDFMGDDSESDAEDNAAPAPAAPSRARSGRAAAQKVTYVIDDSSDEDMADEEIE